MVDGNNQEKTASNGNVKGVKIPKSGLEEATKLAGQLWDNAKKSSIPQQAFATHLGVAHSSGTFRTRVGLLRYFDLIKSVGGKIQLSETGVDVVQDYDKALQLEARKKAFLKQKHYNSMLQEYAGHELPSVDSLASRFQYDYQLKPDSAKKAAKAFADSVSFAGFIGSTGKVETGGGATDDFIETEDQDGYASKSAKAREPAPPDSPTIPKVNLKNPTVNPAPVINLTINLDLGNATKEQIETIFKELKR